MRILSRQVDTDEYKAPGAAAPYRTELNTPDVQGNVDTAGEPRAAPFSASGPILGRVPGMCEFNGL